MHPLSPTALGGPSSDRSLAWEGCVNVRDLGGLFTASGLPTRPGALVRSDNPAFLTPKGWQSFASMASGPSWRCAPSALRTIAAADEAPDEVLIPSDVEVLRVSVEEATDQDFYENSGMSRLWGTPPPCTSPMP